MNWLTDFHLLRPFWLLSLLPLPLVIWWLWRQNFANSGWQKLVHPDLLKRLITDDSPAHKGWLWLLSAIWCLLTLAMAGPSWYQVQTPLSAAPNGRVLIMDMSLSLLATDLKPNRLVQARYKAMDLLDGWQEGDTGLISFAGDAYVLSPLTSDINNLKTMIPALDPSIMPAMGSRPDKAVALAIELLTSAGYQKGQLFLIGDEIRPGQQQRIQALLGDRFELSILGVGTPNGGPIRMPDGSLLKMVDGELPVPTLEENTLRKASQNSGGQYIRIRSDDLDIKSLLAISQGDSQTAQTVDGEVWQWHDSGYWLVLLLLPLALSAFRRGLLILLLGVPILLPAPQVKADWLPDALKSDDQLAAESFANGDYAKAAATFDNDAWRAASLYKAGQYEEAAAIYAEFDDAINHYNRGNALAMSQQYQEALDAYNRALELDPELANAATNRQRIMDLMEDNPDQSQGESGDGNDESQQGQPGDEQQEQQGQPGEGDSEENQPDQQPPGDGENSETSKNGTGDQPPQEQTGGEQPPNEAADSDSQPPAGNAGDSELEVDESALKAPQPTPGEQDGSEPDGQAEMPQPQPVTANPEINDDKPEQEGAQAYATAPGEPLSPEEQKLQRWLEQIPDDPSLLLRNKMKLEHLRREKAGETSEETQLW
ncbi:tetratricopeptide repeat protein [Corallincola holothuriorum]|uniref:Tetratricopeptide repeat protein n=1 Tax=Corallincola holothuriorum TaxID=2282215 RepID=A0A368NHL5_9GAMM|nr:VWA domain-containing protein [Corallincola holothuriorum]RCU48899.1 tetratricopeptide repeat protein [Corallincola holothuriorum]